MGEEMMEKRLRAKMAEAEIRWKVKMEIILEISFVFVFFGQQSYWSIGYTAVIHNEAKSFIMEPYTS